MVIIRPCSAAGKTANKFTSVLCFGILLEFLHRSVITSVPFPIFHYATSVKHLKNISGHRDGLFNFTEQHHAIRILPSRHKVLRPRLFQFYQHQMNHRIKIPQLVFRDYLNQRWLFLLHH